MKNTLFMLIVLVLASCGMQTKTKKNRTAEDIPSSFVVTDPPEIEMVFVEGGTFRMGNDRYVNETPSHRVTLSDFYIGKYEVTQKEWAAVMGTTVVTQAKKVRAQEIEDSPDTGFLNEYKTWGEGDNYPMYYVSWDEAQAFISKLNAATGKQYALPTESQWEYAAKGGNKSRNYIYSGSDTINHVAWFSGNSYHNTASPVGTKSANELGIHDMTGNVFEWCSDWYDTYPDSIQVDPVGPPRGRGGNWEEERVYRGGCWYNNARGIQISFRSYNTPDVRGEGLGFRLVLLPVK